MQHTACSARTVDYLTVAIKKSQHVPFQGRHDCRLTTACTNSTQRHLWVRARARATVAAFSVCETNAVQDQRICFSYGVRRGVRLWNINFGNWNMFYSVQLFAERIQRYGFEWETAGKSVRGSRLFLSAANWTAQRNGKASCVVFSICNTNVQVCINLLHASQSFLRS